MDANKQYVRPHAHSTCTTLGAVVISPAHPAPHVSACITAFHFTNYDIGRTAAVPPVSSADSP